MPGPGRWSWGCNPRRYDGRMPPQVLTASLLLFAYLLGSASGSLLLGRWRGVDIRQHGSGNAGGTNALRTQGWKFALGVVLIDIGKGVLATWIALRYAPVGQPLSVTAHGYLAAMLAGAAVLGGCTDTRQLHGLGNFALLDHFDHLGQRRNQAGLLKHCHIHFSGTQLFQCTQSYLCVVLQGNRFKAALGQATLQRHLTALKAHLVVATRAGLLTFVTTAGGFTQTRTNATANATLSVFGTFCGFDAIEFHHQSFTELSPNRRFC